MSDEIGGTMELRTNVVYHSQSDLTCPVCNTNGDTFGVTKLKIGLSPESDIPEITGDYCTRCYFEWFSKTIPRMVKKSD